MARKWLGIDPNAADESRHYNAIHLAQCQLSLVSGSLKLLPYGGQYLSIAGINRKVPSAGITLAATGLTVSTLYYIYAQYSAGTMSLVASTTAFVSSTDASNIGVAVMSGDATKSLVGMAYVTTGPAFSDTSTARLVRSYYNRVAADVTQAIVNVNSTSTATWTALSTVVSVLHWAEEIVRVMFSGTMFSTTINTTVYATIGIDGTAQTSAFTSAEESVAGGYAMSASCMYSGKQTVGLHQYTVQGKVSGATGTYTGAIFVSVG